MLTGLLLLAFGAIPAVQLVDRAANFGITRPNTYGSKDHQQSILESTGNGIVIFDYDGDGSEDVFIANGVSTTPGAPATPSQLYRNDRKGHFAESAAAAGFTRTMGVAVTDFDGNGFLDIVKTNFSGDRPSLYRNVDRKFFEDVSEPAGLGVHQLLGWGVAFVAVDDDGLPDLIMANGHVYPQVDKSAVGEHYRQPTLLFRNLGNGRFGDITSASGPALAVARPARGLATGDLDGDGPPEIVIVNMNQAPSVLKNLGTRQNAVAVRLAGTKSNRSAIGARCTIEAGGKRQMQEVLSGGSYYSQNSLTQYFGLGRLEVVDSLAIRWPSGQTQKWSRIPGNRTPLLTEGSEEVKSKPWVISTD